MGQTRVVQATQARLDELDRTILAILQTNARISNAEVGRQLGVSTSTVFNRIHRLEESGVTRAYEARIAPAALGYHVTAFVSISPTELSREDDIEEALLRMPEVLEIHKVAGEDSFLIKIRAFDNESLADLMRRGVENAGVKAIRTTIVLETARERHMLPCQAKEP